MDFEFFESLTPVQATKFFENYLRIEEAASHEFTLAASRAGVVADHSLESLRGMFEWVSQQAATLPTEPDESVPEWIRATEVYQRGLYELDEASKVLMLRASYYLGEAFVRAFPGALRWSVGNREYAQANQPVVAGFLRDLELPPLMVAENAVLRLVEEKAGAADSVDTAVGSWLQSAPHKR